MKTNECSKCPHMGECKQIYYAGNEEEQHCPTTETHEEN